MKIVTVTATRRPHMWTNIVERLEAQVRKPDLSVVLLHGLDVSRFGNRSRYIIKSMPPSARLGEILNHGMELGAATGADLYCIWDDDDWYGPEYLAQVEAAYLAHPDAWLLGKHAYRTRWVDEPGRAEEFFAAPSADGRSHWLAGPTICVPELRRREHGLAYRTDLSGPVDSTLLQETAVRWNKAVGNPEPYTQFPPFYSTGPDQFYLQRYSAQHDHHWKCP